ncbi:MAG: fumarylacetoacetate hydrolase family protein [Thermoplasmatota archaeon]
MRYFQFQEPVMKKIGVGKIICLARTYKKHADEMKSSLPKSPLLFLKPASAIIFSGEAIRIPDRSTCLHHEVELGIVIGEKSKNITVNSALDIVLGYAVGLDITARDIQAEAKKRGWPWGIAKGFDTFAPLSEVVLKERISNPNNVMISLTVNDELRQRGNTKNLHWSVEKIISFVSSIMTLEKGDVILTGTPEGVNSIRPGDRLRGVLSEENELCSIEVFVEK